MSMQLDNCVAVPSILAVCVLVERRIGQMFYFKASARESIKLTYKFQFIIR